MTGNTTKKNRSVSSRFYSLTLFMLVLTGFAQMPIFKRYHIADIPGLGWLGEFYVTHFMHYLFAVIFIGYAGYRLTVFFISGIKRQGWTLLEGIRVTILSGLVITGAFLVVKNLSGVYVPPAWIIIMDLAHLSLVMGLLISLLAGLFIQRR